MALDQDEKDHLKVDTHGDFDRIVDGAGSSEVSAGLVMQIAVLGSHGKRLDADASNFALGFVDSMKPQDAAEALLLTQMATTHQATMMLARRLNHVGTIPQQDAAERALNKLARTYANQMETLKRYRSKGQQLVRVERVTVESGAQAVVGNVNHGGGVMSKADANPIDRANAAPRCMAKAKRTSRQCCAPAVKGWRVCRVHGARGGARPGKEHPNYKHGGRTKEAVAVRKMVAQMIRESRETEQWLEAD